MVLSFMPLLEEAEKPEYSRWHPLLHHLALLHESSMYTHPSSPAPYPLETLGPGYYFNPAFSHWDLTHSLLDSCPVMPEHTLRQLENMLCFQREDGSLAGAIFFRGDPPVPRNYSNFPAIWPLAVDEYTRCTGSDRAVKMAIEPLLKQIPIWKENGAQTVTDSSTTTPSPRNPGRAALMTVSAVKPFRNGENFPAWMPHATCVIVMMPPAVI